MLRLISTFLACLLIAGSHISTPERRGNLPAELIEAGQPIAVFPARLSDSSGKDLRFSESNFIVPEYISFLLGQRFTLRLLEICDARESIAICESYRPRAPPRA